VDFATFLRRIGRNLRKARWRKGLTQQDVATHGFTYRYLQEIERGVRNPSLKMLFELAEVLDIRVADLVEVGDRRASVKLADVPESAAPKRGRKPSPRRRARRM
jgi:transcriptional regulator with XRE-family HTH domain